MGKAARFEGVTSGECVASDKSQKATPNEKEQGNGQNAGCGF
jgi:hypothetical protein